MSWPGEHLKYVVPAMTLTHEQTMRYLALRRARRIGMLWCDSGHLALAPLGVDMHSCAEAISVIRLMNLIEALECQPKPVASVEALEPQEESCAA